MKPYIVFLAAGVVLLGVLAGYIAVHAYIGEAQILIIFALSYTLYIISSVGVALLEKGGGRSVIVRYAMAMAPFAVAISWPPIVTTIPSSVLFHTNISRALLDLLNLAWNLGIAVAFGWLIAVIKAQHREGRNWQILYALIAILGPIALWATALAASIRGI